MSATIFRPENVQKNLQRMVAESPMSKRTIAEVTRIPLATLTAKLDGEDCRFSVREVADIAMACGQLPDSVFEIVPDVRPCAVNACMYEEHEWTNETQFRPCSLASIEGDGFLVHGNLLEHGWEAWADADGLADGHEGIEQTRALLKAFGQMQAQCDALNGAPLERHTEPGEPEFAGIGGGL